MKLKVFTIEDRVDRTATRSALCQRQAQRQTSDAIKTLRKRREHQER